jgi:hypothetical protein
VFGVAGGLVAFLVLKGFNLLFEDPNHPVGTTEPWLYSSTFVLYGKDLARLACFGAAMVAPLAAWGRRGTAKENWQALFVGLVLGALAGVITVGALGYLFAPDAVSAYADWFGGGNDLGSALETLKWVIRVPWAGTWVVFGCFATWFVATQSQARRVLATAVGGLVVGAAGAGTLELAFNVDDIDTDVWTLLLCIAMGAAIGVTMAIAVPRSTPPQQSARPALATTQGSAHV